ncbi:MAG: phosphoenolpyruvate carboxykinase domain-containing protein, partial [Candidatus Omnitrophica bacterium]|nr:phosphoenolpyruvate carboxykinase domain-containing protein [Candidatus Omnitrophota bacterium]
ISAIILGGRRTQRVPLVVESFNWQHGVFVGARTGSETTAAAAGQVGTLRRDPMAMIPFCGYNMGDYFSHWLKIGTRLKHPPKIFGVNWFRTNDKGEYLWPGFGENIRVLKWIIDRVNNRIGAKETPIGFVPELKSFDTTGLHTPAEKLQELFAVKTGEWQEEAKDIEKFFAQFGSRLPKAMAEECAKLTKALK